MQPDVGAPGSPEFHTPEVAPPEPEVFVDPGFQYRDLPDMLDGAGPLPLVLAWTWGASFIGAEWHTGFLTTLLTWEPRRVRLFAAKAIACLAVTAAATLVLCALFAAAMLPARHGAVRSQA